MRWDDLDVGLGCVVGVCGMVLVGFDSWKVVLEVGIF